MYCISLYIYMKPGSDPDSGLLRWIHCDDGSFSPEEEDRILCHPDLPPVHHDRHSFPSVFLVEQRISAGQDCVWWVPYNGARFFLFFTFFFFLMDCINTVCVSVSCGAEVGSYWNTSIPTGSGVISAALMSVFVCVCVASACAELHGGFIPTFVSVESEHWWMAGIWR